MMKRIYALLIMSVILGTAGLRAKTTTVENKSDQPINVYFQAYGCFKAVGARKGRVCKKAENIGPNQSASYTWKGGQTGKRIIIRSQGNRFYTERFSKIKDKYIWQGCEQGLYWDASHAATKPGCVPKNSDFSLNV